MEDFTTTRLNYGKKIIKNFIEKYNTYYENVYFRAIVLSLIAFLCLRIFTSSVLLIDLILPSPEPPYSEVTQEILTDLEQQSGFTRLFLAPWYRWDTARYLEIADFGYDFNFINTVWPPLYPFLIKIFNFLFQPSILAAIIVSNLFFIIGLFLTYLLTKDIFNEEVAKKSIFFIVIFPTSFFFVAGYTESMFLAISVAVFLLLRKKKWLWAGILSALATLTRIQGLLLVIPIFIELIREIIEQKKLRRFFIHLISCSYAPFAYGLYSLYVRFGLNTNWPWMVLSSNWEQHFGMPWEGIIGSLKVFFLKMIYNDNPGPVYLINVIFSLFTIYLLIRIRKRIPLSLSVYCWVMLLVILGKIDINNALVSTIRYLLILFPLFMGQALFIKGKYKLMYTTFNICLQVLLLVVFYWWLWVG
ncbi:MAG: hypothetical protein CVU41_14225 [Chloroflexi bacterium HGW-Chloroflexi-3]|nr:MAG: hypothetical protein CVU41_14225 [Chloroflexi bacterium HGW-Chloroflexi-3]